jgi:Na+-transporting methylmalonyl-CoA/oxaloacetate decarboxylase gamma subunit
MVQLLSRWMTIAQAERLVLGFNLTTLGIAFIFLITLTILAK